MLRRGRGRRRKPSRFAHILPNRAGPRTLEISGPSGDRDVTTQEIGSLLDVTEKFRRAQAREFPELIGEMGLIEVPAGERQLCPLDRVLLVCERVHVL
jgi:hypothetical protein